MNEYEFLGMLVGGLITLIGLYKGVVLIMKPYKEIREESLKAQREQTDASKDLTFNIKLLNKELVSQKEKIDTIETKVEKHTTDITDLKIGVASLRAKAPHG